MRLDVSCLRHQESSCCCNFTSESQCTYAAMEDISGVAQISSPTSTLSGCIQTRLKGCSQRSHSKSREEYAGKCVIISHVHLIRPSSCQTRCLLSAPFEHFECNLQLDLQPFAVQISTYQQSLSRDSVSPFGCPGILTTQDDTYQHRPYSDTPWVRSTSSQ